MNNQQYVVTMGNPADGFRIIGPFSDFDAAQKYLEHEISRENCWVMALDSPAADEI